MTWTLGTVRKRSPRILSTRRETVSTNGEVGLDPGVGPAEEVSAGRGRPLTAGRSQGQGDGRRRDQQGEEDGAPVRPCRAPPT